MIRSATCAYRADLASRTDSFGPRDGGWIAVANLVEQAALLPAERRQTIVGRAIDLARELLEENPLYPNVPEWSDDAPSRSDAILLVADRAFQAGAFHLAGAILQSLLDADQTLTPLQRGRIIARRARVDARLGRLEEAADQYVRLEREGRRLRLPELQARAWNGLGALAQMRGNYPEQERWARRVARVADRLGMRVLSQQAHCGIVITAGMSHRFDEAIEHARIAWRAAVGSPMQEAEVLQNVGQLLVEAGHMSFAAGVFRSVLARPLPLRFVFPALGGLALASGTVGDATAVAWAATETERLRLTSGVPPYNIAIAALECATGLSLIGQWRDAERMLDLAVGVARTHGYYEVIVKADAVRARDAEALARADRPLGAAAERLARELQAEESERLPDHVQLVAAP